MTTSKAKKASAAKKGNKKTVTKKPTPSSAKSKASSKKPVAKKAVAKNVVSKKSTSKKTASKVASKKVVAKKAVSAKAKSSKPVATKNVAKKVVAKKAAVKKVAVKKVAVKKTATKKVVAKKVSSKPTKVAKAPVKAPAKVAAKTNTKPAEDTPKKSPRAAKAISLMPPPPGQVVASTTAKASYTPMAMSQLPTLVPLVHKKDAKLANNWKSKPVHALSDEEVLSMPDSEYMNDTQMAFFKLKLIQLKTDILANAEGTTEHLREDTVVVPDPADRATIEEEHALELRTRDRERKLLKKIEQSITRIDAGDYGYCDETGEPIGVGRLLARPTATLSLEAQQRRELKQKMFGD